MLEEDRLPEYSHYRDEGCEFASSCLSCPFPRCVYEEFNGKRQWLKGLRNREMHRLFYAEGKRAREIAQRFEVSERTVQRALKAVKNQE